MAEDTPLYFAVQRDAREFIWNRGIEGAFVHQANCAGHWNDWIVVVFASGQHWAMIDDKRMMLLDW